MRVAVSRAFHFSGAKLACCRSAAFARTAQAWGILLTKMEYKPFVTRGATGGMPGVACTLRWCLACKWWLGRPHAGGAFLTLARHTGRQAVFHSHTALVHMNPNSSATVWHLDQFLTWVCYIDQCQSQRTHAAPPHRDP